MVYWNVSGKKHWFASSIPSIAIIFEYFRINLLNTENEAKFYASPYLICFSEFQSCGKLYYLYQSYCCCPFSFRLTPIAAIHFGSSCGCVSNALDKINVKTSWKYFRLNWNYQSIRIPCQIFMLLNEKYFMIHILKFWNSWNNNILRFAENVDGNTNNIAIALYLERFTMLFKGKLFINELKIIYFYN